MKKGEKKIDVDGALLDLVDMHYLMLVVISEEKKN